MLAIAAGLLGSLLDALILVLFFFADTTDMFLLGRRRPLARLGPLFGAPRSHSPVSGQNLRQAQRQGQRLYRYWHPAAACAAAALVFPSYLPALTPPIGVALHLK